MEYKCGRCGREEDVPKEVGDARIVKMGDEPWKGHYLCAGDLGDGCFSRYRSWFAKPKADGFRYGPSERSA